MLDDKKLNLLCQLERMRIHFKHVYGPEVPQWGVVGFTSVQPAKTALENYRHGDRALLAVPEDNGHEGCRGKIFGMCTLLHLPGLAITQANKTLVATMPEIVTRWCPSSYKVAQI